MDVAYVKIYMPHPNLAATVSSQPFWETIEVPSDPKMDMNI